MKSDVKVTAKVVTEVVKMPSYFKSYIHKGLSKSLQGAGVEKEAADAYSSMLHVMAEDVFCNYDRQRFTRIVVDFYDKYFFKDEDWSVFADRG